MVDVSFWDKDRGMGFKMCLKNVSVIWVPLVRL